MNRITTAVAVTILLATCTPATSLLAEVVLLKNGQTLSGQIAGQSASGIFLVTSTGVKQINKGDLVKIQYVPFTQAQKDQALAVVRKRRAAEQARLAKIRAARIAEAEREKQLAAEQARIDAVKLKEAQERASRAAALRELVDKGKMEKPDGEPISFWDFAWRSMVLPGWGHFYLDRPVIGSLYVAGTVAMLGGVYETRRRARAAVRENREQVQTNFLLSIQPSLASLEIRTAYAYYSNARAYLPIQSKVDNYHYALYSLGMFYGLQVLHIIYNGIAWENGLLIVKNDTPEVGKLRPQFAILPDVDTTSRYARAQPAPIPAAQFGVSWNF